MEPTAGDFGLVIDSTGKIKAGRGGGVGPNSHVIGYAPVTVSDAVPHIATMAYKFNPGDGQNSLLDIYVDGRPCPLQRYNRVTRLRRTLSRTLKCTLAESMQAARFSPAIWPKFVCMTTQ